MNKKGANIFCWAVLGGLCLVLSVYLSGCGDKFWDPTGVGRWRPVPAVNVILDSLGVADETPSTWEGAEEPKPIDVMFIEADYALGPGDVVIVSVFELLQEGVLFANQYVVTETGKISIPEVGVIPAAGLTESQLEEEIRDILRPGILKEPSVTVTLAYSERRSFSILGNGVERPGRYSIPRYGFRLSDALATSGGIGEFNVSGIYISRPLTGKEVTAGVPGMKMEPGKPKEKPVVPEQEMMEIIAPRAKQQQTYGAPVIASAEMANYRELARAALPETFATEGQEKSMWETLRSVRYGKTAGEAPVSDGRDNAETVPGKERQGQGRIEWIFRDGRWVPVQVGEPEPQVKKVAKKPEPIEEKAPADFGWEEIGTAGAQTRVIKIAVDKFQSGDPKYNIAIRPGDSIYVPVDIIGEFYITGNVNRQGAIPLTGRPMTLKMAIAAAGGLGPLAWPKRCEVIRRLGKNTEEIVMVDLDKIFSGEQPDFFIKINDLINVGTHPTSQWRAIMRNAFRATYGFGFVYDRNFADRDFGTHRPFPDWSW